METYTVSDEASLPRVAAAVLAALPPRAGATVVTLVGELGAGKTAFVKALAATMGVREVVTSPTFVVMKSYPLTYQHFTRLVHIDAYRLESVAEVPPLQLETYLADSTVLLCIEWPQVLREVLPPVYTELSITSDADNVRHLTVVHHG